MVPSIWDRCPGDIPHVVETARDEMGADGETRGMSDATLTGDQIAAANLADWRPLLNALHTRFRTGSFKTGLELVNQIGEAAEAANHHPDLDLRYPLLN